jgi:hypothetical protein
MLTNDIDHIVESIKATKEHIDSLLQVQSMIDQRHFSRVEFRLKRLEEISEYLRVELGSLTK